MRYFMFFPTEPDIRHCQCAVEGLPSNGSVLETALFELVKDMVEHQQNTIDTQADLMRQLLSSAPGAIRQDTQGMHQR